MTEPTDQRRTSVITAFVVRGGELLLLRRSGEVGSYRGRWAGVSGYLEVTDPEQQARVELAEELGLTGDDVLLEAAGEPLPVDDHESGRRWLVHPFRFRLAPDTEPRLDWEHVELRWASSEQILGLDTVPGLWDAWLCVADGFGDAPGAGESQP